MPDPELPSKMIDYGAAMDAKQRTDAIINLKTIDQTPDTAARTLRNSIQQGLPFGFGSIDPEGFNKDAEETKNKNTLSEHPRVEKYIADNEFAAPISHDDLSNLGMVEKALKAFSSGYESGVLTGRLGTVASGYTKGLGPLPEEATQILEKMKKQPKFEGFGYGMAQNVASMVGHFIHAAGGPGGYAGLAAGALAGTAGGPLGEVTVPVGAFGGFLIGTFSKMAIDDATSAYLELDREVSPSGQKIPEVAKQSASLAIGLASFFGMKAGATPAAREFAKDLVKEALKKPTIARALGNAAMSTAEAGATGGVVNAGMEFANTIAKDVAKYTTDPEFKTIINDPEKRAEFRDRLIESFELGAALVGTVHFPLAGASLLTDAVRINQAKTDQANLDTVRNTVINSDTFKRSPEAMRVLIGTVLPGEKLSIPADAIAERLRYDQAVHLFEGVVDNFVGKFDQAYMHGGDIEVPIEKLLTAPDELWNALREDFRAHDGVTPREAAKLAQSGPEAYAPIEPERVAVPAIEHKGQLYSGVIHPDAVENAAKKLGVTPEEIMADPSLVEGFVTTAGRFIGREEAAKMAEAHGQFEPIAGEELGAKLYADNLKTLEDPKAYAKAHEAIARSQRGQLLPGETVPLLEDLRPTAKREMWLKPLFKDAAAAGMTKDEFKRYSKSFADADAKEFETELARKKKLIEKRETKEWKENEKAVTDEVEMDLAYRPDILADNYFRTGMIGPNKHEVVKLDRDGLVEVYGKDVLDQLPRSSYGKDGVDPADLAGPLGFKTGPDLVRALRDLKRERGELSPKQHFDKLVDEEVADRMEDRYGDPVQNVLDRAREMVGTGGRADLVSDEFFALAKQIHGDLPPQFNKETIKQQLAKNFKERGQGVVRSKTFARDAGTNGRKAELALLAGDKESAFLFKQRQFIALEMFKLARSFERQQRKTQRFIDRYQDNVVLDKVDQKYTDQIHGVLFDVGLDIPRTPQNLGEAVGKTKIDDFVQKEAARGRLIEAPDIPFGKQFQDFTVGEATAFGKLLESLDYNGKAEKFLLKGREQVDFNTVVDEAVLNMKDIQGRPKTLEDNILRKAGRSIDASMIKSEQRAEWMDKGNPDGPATVSYYRPLSQAETWKLDVLRELGKEFQKTAKKFDRKWRRSLRDSVNNTTLIDHDTGKPMELDRDAMLTMALNMGNDSNRAKLTQGYGWTETDVMSFLDANMSKEDWEFVQGTWDTLKILEPHIKERTRRMTGVAVDLIDPVQVDTQHGSFRGGYYPLIEDDLSKIIRQKEDVNVFDSPVFQLLPTAAAVKKRTGKMYPLSLTLDALRPRLEETVHYLAFAEPVLNGRKFIGDPRIRKAMADAFGPESIVQEDKWLDHVASNGGQMDNAALNWWVRASRYARGNATVMAIGLNTVTAVLHGGSAFLNSMREVGWEGKAAFLAKTAQVPVETLALVYNNTIAKIFKSPELATPLFDRVYAKSGEIRHRSDKIDSDFGTLWEKSLGKNTLRTQFAHFSMSLVANLDLWSAIATWDTINEIGLRKGLGEEEAIARAEKAVRDAHGASGITDLAAIQRGGEFLKWNTMFMGYFVHNYNRNRNTARIAMDKTMLQGNAKWAAVGAGAMFYLIGPALLHEVLRGKEHKKDEGWGSYMADVATMGIASQLGGGIPYLRDALYAIEHGKAPRTILEDVIGGWTAPFRDLNKWAHGEKVDKNYTQHAIEFPGWVWGRSNRWLGKEGQFLWDYAQGNKNPQSFSEWWRELVTHYPKPKEEGGRTRGHGPHF